MSRPSIRNGSALNSSPLDQSRNRRDGPKAVGNGSTVNSVSISWELTLRGQTIGTRLRHGLGPPQTLGGSPHSCSRAVRSLADDEPDVNALRSIIGCSSPRTAPTHRCHPLLPFGKP